MKIHVSQHRKAGTPLRLTATADVGVEIVIVATSDSDQAYECALRSMKAVVVEAEGEEAGVDFVNRLNDQLNEIKRKEAA